MGYLTPLQQHFYSIHSYHYLIMKFTLLNLHKPSIILYLNIIFYFVRYKLSKDFHMKKVYLLLTVLFFTVSCSKTDADSIKLKSEDEKTFYTLGYSWGDKLKTLNISEREFKALIKGATASVNDTKSEVDLNTYSAKINKMASLRAAAITNKEKENGKKFIADYLKEHSNAKQTSSGLVYEIMKQGTGKKPAATDKVEVHYHGTLTNGDVFDSSVARGQKISFPLNRVIKGWTEGLQLVKEGGKIKLIIPSDLAYGNAGSPPKIPGGATLIFTVELFKVNP